ncbi:hypothetical protein ACWWJS_21510 [Enterobacter cloacae]
MIITTKVSLRPHMKPLLILSALLHWDWLTRKCFKVEMVEGNTAIIESK